jgi:hypothetical protein
MPMGHSPCFQTGSTHALENVGIDGSVHRTLQQRAQTENMDHAILEGNRILCLPNQ